MQFFFAPHLDHLVNRHKWRPFLEEIQIMNMKLKATPQEDNMAAKQAITSRTTQLQSMADDKRVDDIVYGWLRQYGIDVHEDASEQLVGHLCGLVSRVRQGLDKSDVSEVLASIEATNLRAIEYNASPRIKRKIPLIQLAYDGNHVENHCPVCNAFESECQCEADVNR